MVLDRLFKLGFQTFRDITWQPIYRKDFPRIYTKSAKVTIYVNLMMVLEVNEKEEQMVSTAYTTQKGFYRGTRLE